MGFRNPITSLAADQITAGTLATNVIGQALATAASGRRVVIGTPSGSAGVVDFYGDPDGPGGPEGHADIAVTPVGGASGLATLDVAAAGAHVLLTAQSNPVAGWDSVIQLQATLVTISGRQMRDTGLVAPVLAAGWGLVGGAYEPPGIELIDGMVFGRGLVAATAAQAGGARLFTLPVGYRPSAAGTSTSHLQVFTTMYGATPYSITVLGNGDVVTGRAMSIGDSVSLNPIVFRALG